MKHTLELEKIQLEELSFLELSGIDGGKGFWYDLAYLVIGGFKSFSDGAASFARSNPIYYK